MQGRAAAMLQLVDTGGTYRSTAAAQVRIAVSVNAATRGTEFFDTDFSLSSQNIRIGSHACLAFAAAMVRWL